MTQPIDNRTLGGLTYNHNMVRSAEKLDNGNYEIIFKTGETLTYPEQKDFVPEDKTFPEYAKTGENLPPEEMPVLNISKKTTVPRHAQIKVSIEDGLFYDKSKFNIANVMGATFSSEASSNRAEVLLYNSSDCTIDLSNIYGAQRDNAEIRNGARNKVELDRLDTAIINGKDVEGEGIANQEDYRK